MSSAETEGDLSRESLDDDADTCVLLQSVKGMIDVIETQAGYYNDARRRLVERHLYHPRLSVTVHPHIYIRPSITEEDHRMWNEKMQVLSARLRQLGNDREAALKETQTAFERLKVENDVLQREVTRLRRQMTDGPHKTHSSDSRSHRSKLQ
jgi:hypothetical protein